MSSLTALQSGVRCLMNSPGRHPWIWLLVLLAGTVCLYYPALHSAFLLDDVNNLRDLALLKQDGWLHYIFNNDAGPTGRPLAMFSFAMQASQWPDPFGFKLVNLLIHLVNGGLVFLICSRVVTAQVVPGRQKALFCLLLTALWLMHPMHLTSVLYVVQRMTLLASTFMLLTVLLYLHSWDMYNRGQRRGGIAGLLAAFGLLMPLAVFSKEIGILAGLYTFVIYQTLLRDKSRDGTWNLATLVCALFPVICVLAWLLVSTDLEAAYAIRPFSLYERLITEPVILLDYIRLLVLPQGSRFSVFHDDVVALSSMTVTAMAAIIIVVLSLVFAIAGWKKYPVFAFAILWFFSGHVLESGFIPLELYFEHRNYLPSLGILFLVVWLLFRIHACLSMKTLGIGIALVYVSLVVFTTKSGIGLWAQPLLQAEIWKMNQPQSRRALNNLWIMHMQYGNHERAEELFHEFRTIYPQDFYPMIRYINYLECHGQRRPDEADWQQVTGFAAQAAQLHYSVVTTFDNILYRQYRGKCKIEHPEYYLYTLEALINNPAFRSVRANLHELAASYAALAGDGQRALVNINRALRERSTIANLIFKARILHALDRADDARKLVERIENRLASRPGMALLYRKQIETLAKEINRQEDDPS